MPSSDEINAQNLQNPFASSDPVTEPSCFYGHPSDIQRIYARIGADRPQSVSIIGERSMGKSSLLNILTHPDTKAELLSKPDRYLFGYIHLRQRGDWTPDKFLYALTDSLRKTHPDVPETPDYDGFRDLIQRLDSERLFLIAFFDDFDVITRNPDIPLTFISFLRSMANTYNVAYVTTSSELLQKLCANKDIEESPFFNIFTNIILKPLSQAEVRQWVIERANPSGVSLNSEVDWVYTQVGGFPALVRTLCALLWELKRRQGKLNGKALAGIEIIFQEHARDILESIWGGFSQQEQDLCAHLLKSVELDRPQMPLARELGRRGYVVETDGSNALFGRTFERFVASKSGIELEDKAPKKRRWWQ